MHEQHRERLRDRILGHGLESLADHELLEFYLFYAIPRADTNGLAHELLRRFGSLNAVLEASVDELQEVPGVGLRTAMLLSVPLELLRRYALGRTGPVRRYDTVSKIAGYFCSLFAGLTRERLYAMLLNSDMPPADRGSPVQARRGGGAGAQSPQGAGGPLPERPGDDRSAAHGAGAGAGDAGGAPGGGRGSLLPDSAAALRKLPQRAGERAGQRGVLRTLLQRQPGRMAGPAAV